VTNFGVSIVRTANFDVVPWVPVIVTVDVLATAMVATAKFAEVVPAGTVTDAGTVALAPLEERFTTMPPEGAGPDSETVPTTELLPSISVGETVTEYRVTPSPPETPWWWIALAAIELPIAKLHSIATAANSTFIFFPCPPANDCDQLTAIRGASGP